MGEYDDNKTMMSPKWYMNWTAIHTIDTYRYSLHDIWHQTIYNAPTTKRLADSLNVEIKELLTISILFVSV